MSFSQLVLNTALWVGTALGVACGADDPGGAATSSSKNAATVETVEPEHPEPLVDPSLPPAAAGRILYEKLECAGCHESAAVPGLVVIPLRDLDSRFTDESLAAWLSAPKPPMPNFALVESERHALAVHLRTRFR